MSTSNSLHQLKLSSLKPAVVTWLIYDFTDETDEIEYDGDFASADKPEIRFDLICYSNFSINVDASEDNQEYVIIMLRRIDGLEEKCSVRHRIAIINAKNEHCFAQDNFAIFPHDVYDSEALITSGMFFINRKYLLDDANGLLVDGSLKVYCEIHFLDEQTIKSDVSKSDVSIKSDVSADQLLHEASKNFESLLENCNFSDVTLVVGNKELKAHKNVLSSRSPVFMAMFEHDCKEVEEGKVNIPDVQVDAFEELLRYIYTGKVNVLKYALDLLVAADKYQMSSLKEYCEQYLMANLSIDTSCETLLIADLLQVSQLKAKCLEFMNENVSAVMATDGWKRLADEKRFDLVAELYQHLGAKNGK